MRLITITIYYAKVFNFYAITEQEKVLSSSVRVSRRSASSLRLSGNAYTYSIGGIPTTVG